MVSKGLGFVYILRGRIMIDYSFTMSCVFFFAAVSTVSLHLGTTKDVLVLHILFNFYISNIPQTTDTNIALFADDTTIYCNSSDTQIITTALQNYLNKISLWCLKWKIIISPSKT
ncbi:Uncharacterized protein FWK35_00014113 [Aphis craccivora]|uniref:Reverse transcriptase domain-containing protein n=1 Tax=Aphis craccivora TaxID=307492 RepID=A0A6G0YYV1_APHCR|nr:Uncharacterized protein FWK35_00014113 [Aphis craccivora]